MLMVSPAVCQRISSVEQDDHITEYDRQQFLNTRFMFLIINDVEPGKRGGQHWSLMVVDLEAGNAHHYNSLPSHKPQQAAAQCALKSIGVVLRQSFAFSEDPQTPHQMIDNRAKTEG